MSNQILAASVHAKVPKKVKILQNELTASIARVGSDVGTYQKAILRPQWPDLPFVIVPNAAKP